jgi:outer membrane autotransporter protein
MSTVAVTPALNAVVDHQETVVAALEGAGGLVPEKGAAAGSAGQRGAAWGQFLAGTATRDQAPGAAGYGAQTYGLLVGVDWAITPTLIAGGAVSWIDSTATGHDLLTGSNTKLSSYQFTAYGSWRPEAYDGRLSIDAQAEFATNSYKQHREIQFLGEAASAKYDGQQYLANIVAGYAFPFTNGGALTPYYSLREIHLTNAAYSESGAGIADMAVNSVSTDSLTQEIGFKASTEFDTSAGKLIPTLRLGWVHDYTDGPIPLTANLAGIVFTSTTARPAADGAVIGATLDLKRTDNFDLTIEYDGEIRKDFQSHTGLIKGTFKF